MTGENSNACTATHMITCVAKLCLSMLSLDACIKQMSVCVCVSACVYMCVCVREIDR